MINRCKKPYAFLKLRIQWSVFYKPILCLCLVFKSSEVLSHYLITLWIDRCLICFPSQFFLIDKKKGPVSKLGERWLRVISYNDKVEVFFPSNEEKFNDEISNVDRGKLQGRLSPGSSSENSSS